MSATIRQVLATLLENGEYSARDLARELRLTPREVEEHLVHLRRSRKSHLRITPARCRGCGFTFSSRERLAAPGRCPRCRQQRIQGPWFRLQATDRK